jgi:hypothetical protein
MNLRPLRARASPFVSTSRYTRRGSKIALDPAPLTLAIDGKPAKTTWARGDVQFIGRGVPHEAKNTGGNTFLRA